MATPGTSKLLLELTARRRPYFWRVLRSLVVLAFMLLGIYTLDEAVRQNRIASEFWLPGILIFGALAVLFGVRALLNFWRWLRQRNETARFYDRGFVWTINDENHQYGWSALRNFREGGRGLYRGERPLFQWGAHTLTMSDGRKFRVTGAFGDLRKALKVLRRPTAHVMVIQIGQKLRHEQPVRVHPKLVLWPGGIEVNKHQIPWSEVEVKLDGTRLSVLRKSKDGQFGRVRSFSTHSLDNLGGFMEVARTTIRNHQRDRFGV
jgi:hypothetical protein